jgi:RHS repeat-associated protein
MKKIHTQQPMQLSHCIQSSRLSRLPLALLFISPGIALMPLSAKADSPVTHYEYDANGNLTKVTDGLSNAASQRYDAVDRLIQQSQPHPDTAGAQLGNTSTQYNAMDAVTDITDPRGLATTYTKNAFGDVLTLSSPDTGITVNTYDDAGNLITRTDARNETLSYRYDSLGRLIKMGYGSGLAVIFSYDQGNNGIGRLTQMIDPAGTTSWTYNNQGRVTSKTYVYSSLKLVTRYAYYSDGHLKALTYPSGKSVQLTYQNGLVTAMDSDGKALVSNINYQPFAAPVDWVFGNGIKASREFDLDGRLIAYELGNRIRELTYDAAGRVADFHDTDLNYDQAFSYDGVSRLTGVDTPSSQIGYSYDVNGNRTQKMIGAISETSTIDAGSNRLLGVAKNSTLKNYQYDAAGNVINDGRNQFTYDGRGRLVKAVGSFGSEQYLINGLGQRLAKVQGGTIDMAGDANQDGSLTATDLRLIVLMTQGTTPVNLAGDCNHDGKITRTDALCTQAKMTDMRLNPSKYLQIGAYFVYDESGHLLGEYDQTGKAIQETVWLGNAPVAVMANGKNHFVYTDHLNTPRAIANELGSVVWRWEGEAFGNTLANEDADNDGKAFVYNLRFPGQYYDKATGLHYNGFRDYDPAIGRYIQSDPIGLAGGINTFGYVEGDPLLIADFFGLRGERIILFDPKAPKENSWTCDKCMNHYDNADSQEFPPTGWVYVYGHGNPNSMEGVGNPYALAKRIKKLKSYTAETKIKLISCNVGRNPDKGGLSFAQTLAIALGGGNPVFAADTYVHSPSQFPIPWSDDMRPRVPHYYEYSPTGRKW